MSPALGRFRRGRRPLRDSAAILWNREQPIGEHMRDLNVEIVDEALAPAFDHAAASTARTCAHAAFERDLAADFHGREVFNFNQWNLLPPAGLSDARNIPIRPDEIRESPFGWPQNL
jgi:hypothetical protein